MVKETLEQYKKSLKIYFPNLLDDEIEKLCKAHLQILKDEEDYLIRHPLRHSTKSITEIVYKSWNDFDICTVFANHLKNPLKSVEIGYIFKGDIPENGINNTSISPFLSTEITKNVPKEGIKLMIFSLDEIIKRIKEINWSKVKAEY